MPKPMKLYAVVVTYNRLEYLKQCLSMTLNESCSGIVVVNNASDDGTKEWLDDLSRQHEHIHPIHLEHNCGGSGGFHIGFKYVVESTDADWLVCYDDDAYPKQGAFAVFQSKVASLPHDVAGIASAVYLPNGNISEMNRPSFNPFGSYRRIWNTLKQGRKGFHLNDEAYKNRYQNHSIDYSSFVGCFLNIQHIHHSLGLPRKEFFIYADDIAYTYGIGQAGLKHLFIPEIHFIHDCQTIEEAKGSYNPLWKAYYTYRNGIELFRLISGHYFPLIMMIKLCSWLLSARFYKTPYPFLKIMAIAVYDGMRRDFSRSHDAIVSLSD